MVFRDPTDHGDDRSMVTPPIQSQLLAHRSKWKDINAGGGKHVLPPAAINEIQSHLIHVQRGCLSGIAPGRGTIETKDFTGTLIPIWLVVNMDWNLLLHY